METPCDIAPINARKHISFASISQIVESIATRFHTRKIILFSSYAYGTPRQEIDIDLLIKMDTPLKLSQQTIEIQKYLNPLFGLDLIVNTPETLKRRLLLRDFLLQKIKAIGKVLYVSTDA
jgi:uncharacterized protein